VGHDEAVKDKMSAVVKLRSILACIPETALLTFCTGTLGYFHPVYSLMLPNCVAAQISEHGGWPMEGGAAILIRG
jgi:hypothetical protein